MPAFTSEELDRIGRAEEIEVAPRRSDGKLGTRVTIWIVRAGDSLYVRSAVRGRDAGWYKGVEEAHQGRIWAGRLEKDVDFKAAAGSDEDQVDAVYRAKYRRYAGRILDSVLTADARSTTLELTARGGR